MKRFSIVFVLALCAGNGIAATSDFDFEREMDALLARAVLNGQVPVPPGGGFEIERSARTQLELGAVLDVRRADPAGLPVVAVSPGSSAESAGLQPGDRLLSVNGFAFASGDPAHVLGGALAARDGEFVLAVDRAGQTLALSGRADRRQLPAYRLSVSAGEPVAGCGRVSTFDLAPRRQHIYPAVLIAVNGRLPGPIPSETFRLPVGRHVLLVAEHIDIEQFGSTQVIQRGRGGAHRYKELELEVVANTTYRLGARLIPEQRNEIRSRAYWEPVVYAQREEVCR